jgi:hypothetical protein
LVLHLLLLLLRRLRLLLLLPTGVQQGTHLSL